jgi:quinol monooxygenase YgiN
MAEAVIHVLPAPVDQAQYEAVNEKLNAQADPPAGIIFHAAGQGEDGRWRIIEAWESRDHFDRFNRERLTPAIAEVTGMPAEQVPAADHTWFTAQVLFPR